ncbi:MAG TPA: DUF3611 family protein [Oscillatoriaceae cyanobacterium M33_DOE_052]|uniref:DUF3611 family protein n=1 Tax=Planktothricoides sp. SpSt-374 TaxID=2282167 RepID=A0A7C3ZTU6_9CYAN|nr:DUF3611 family protein [Oscillatoriaceae cyanobacterium M33_DOE_052]
MRNDSEPKALPPTVQRAIPAFRIGGWISFWVQVVLAVVAGIIFLFAVLFERSRTGDTANNPGTNAGIFFAVAGLVALGISIYWAFRYTRLARQLGAAQPGLRPRKADAIQMLRIGVIVNLSGMALSLMAAESITGILLGKALQPQGGRFRTDLSLDQFIQPLDIFVVLANTHTIVAHFAGLITALCLIDWLGRQSKS